MIGRTTGGTSYTLTYDAESHLISVSGSAVASFVYDGDGLRVKSPFGSGDRASIASFSGKHFEVNSVYRESFDDLVAQNWTVSARTWAVQSGGYRQSNTTHTHTNAYYNLLQNRPQVVQWKTTYTSGTQAGLYFYASSAAASDAERGNSYRVWQDASYVYIYEAVNNNAGAYKIRFNATNTVGSSHDYVVRYLTNGRLVVWRDGVNLGGWTDATPLTTGAYLSLRTDGSGVDFDDIEVSRFKKYYEAGGQRLAMRDANTLSWLFSDHLGSTSLTVNASGVRTGELWYKPWGEYRGTAFGTTPTTFRFTGQREDASIGLYYYGARYYDPALGRFIQADTIVPQPGNPQSLNRYSYALNNPSPYICPSNFATSPPSDVDSLFTCAARHRCAPAYLNRYRTSTKPAHPGRSCLPTEAFVFMEVLLKKTVDGLGEAGQIRKVKPGYARNYLIPRGLAMPATLGLRKQADQIKGAADRRRQRELSAARGLAERIRATTLTFKARAGEGGRLYGSVTSTMIADQLEHRLGHEVDRRRLRLEHGLRELGEHEVTVHLASEVDATFKVIVEAEGEVEKAALSEKELEAAAAAQIAATE